MARTPTDETPLTEEQIQANRERALRQADLEDRAKNSSINGTVKDSKFKKDMEEMFPERSGTRDYGRKVGHTDSLHPSTTASVDKYGSVEVRTGGNLRSLEREINTAERELEQARKSLTQSFNSDTTKGSGLAAKRRVEGLEKKLEGLGKKAQKEIFEANKDFEKYASELDKAHSERVFRLETKRDKLVNQIKDIDFEKGKGLDVPEEFGKSITVKTKDGTYLLEKDKIRVVSGDKVSQKNIDAIKSAAQDHVERHYKGRINGHNEMYERAQTELKARTDHINGLKEEFTTKTKVGEFNGKTASVATAGGAEAAAKGVVTKEAYNASSSLGKYMAEVKANALGGGFMGKAKVGVGAVAVLDGLRRGWGAGTDLMSDDPARKQGAATNLVIGLGEIGGGALLAKLGGKALAIGR